MNWEAIGALAELAGAAAVVITLLYLTVQLRQNSALLENASANAHRESQNALTSHLATDREALRVFWAGVEDRNALDDIDRQQFDALVTLFFNSWLQSFQVADRASTDRNEYSLVTWRGVRQWWDAYDDSLPDDFREHVGKVLEKVPPDAQ